MTPLSQGYQTEKLHIVSPLPHLPQSDPFYAGPVLCIANTPSYRRQNNRHVDCGPLNERRRKLKTKTKAKNFFRSTQNNQGLELPAQGSS